MRTQSDVYSLKICDGKRGVFMKFLIIVAITTILFSGCSRKERLAPADERPLYGGEVSSTAAAEDAKQNEIMIRQTGSREVALQKTLDQGLAAYQRGYFELAMHQYNRAWLLDPKSPEVFNGFGLVLDAQGKEDEALSIYEKSLEINPHHPMTLARLARQYQNKVVRLTNVSTSEDTVQEDARQAMTKALEFYQKAAQAATLDVDRDFIYYQWAIGLAVNKDYAGSWEKLHLARKYGGKFIETKFIEVLTQDMPEPVRAPMSPGHEAE